MVRNNKTVSSREWATLSQFQYGVHKDSATHKQKDDLISGLLENAVASAYVAGIDIKTIWTWSREIRCCDANSGFTEAQCSLFQQVLRIPDVIKLSARHRNQKVEMWVVSQEFNGEIQDTVSAMVLKYYDAYNEDIEVVYAGKQDIDFELLPDFEIDFRQG